MTTLTHPTGGSPLSAPSWATTTDGEARGGIAWRRVASVKPLTESAWGAPREEVELVAERQDRIERTDDGFRLVQGPVQFYVVDEFFDLEQFRRLHQAAGELLALIDAEAAR